MAPEPYSWSVGPANARTVRGLLYLAEGLVGGAFAALATSLSLFVLGDGVENVGVFLVFLLLASRWATFHWFARREQFRHERIRWQLAEWVAVRRWPRSVVLAGIVAGGLLAPQLLDRVWVVIAVFAIHPLLVSGFACVFVAFLLSSKGEVVPETYTLRYGERREVDLRYLTDVRRATIGSWTFLWLSAPRGYEDHRELRGPYVLPTETLERVWHVFEAGLATEVETSDGGGPSRTVLSAGIAVVGGTGLAMVAILYAGGMPLPFAVGLGVISFGLLGVVVVASELGLV